MQFGCSRITFNHETKIVPEKMLKALDEYFYLGFGRKFHLFVLPSNQEDQRRSWINIAIKVVSYCSLILPVIGFMTGTVLLAYLHWQNPTPIPQEKIKILKKEPSIEDLQSDLIQWITSPTLGNIDSVAAIMDPLLKLMITKPRSIDKIIQCHTRIAELLAKVGSPVRSEQIQTFYVYLVRKYSGFAFWIVYRIFEQYAYKHQKSNVHLLVKILESYLTQRAKEIRFEDRGDVLEANIDPRDWFGSNQSNYSLWRNPSNRSLTTLPTCIEVAILLRVCSVTRRYPDKKIRVVIHCRMESTFPAGFVSSLRQQLQDIGILLD